MLSWSGGYTVVDGVQSHLCTRYRGCSRAADACRHAGCSVGRALMGLELASAARIPSSLAQALGRAHGISDRNVTVPEETSYGLGSPQTMSHAGLCRSVAGLRALLRLRSEEIYSRERQGKSGDPRS